VYLLFTDIKNVLLSDKKVFGVPMSVVLQRSGQPLPKSILFAMNYLQRTGIINYHSLESMTIHTTLNQENRKAN
jgi:hypothetical protein